MATADAKVKCKYWDKCYRKDADHKNEFLHPSDDDDTDDVAEVAKDAHVVAKEVKKRTHSLSDSEDEEPAHKKPTPSKVKSIQTTIGGSINNDKSKAPPAAMAPPAKQVTATEDKPKCKYWDKCYRKDPDHKKKFEHPKKSTKPKLSKSKEETAVKTDAGDGPSITPKMQLQEGVECDAGSTRYKIKLSNGVYSCTCRGWNNQTEPEAKRTCQHLRDALGEKFEIQRVGESNVNSTKMVDIIPEDKEAPSGRVAATKVLLAHKWDEDSDVDPTGWWMSEKLDGLRAYWDGKRFWSRLGNPFDAPDWFVQDFPKHIHLDGELFGGRGKFQQTMKIVKNHESDDWKQLKYHVFDAPYLKKNVFEERIKIIKDYFDTHPTQYVHLIEHTKVKSKEKLLRDLNIVLDKGGEGLMIREPRSKYEYGRSHTLLKIKKFYDAEAVVIGHEKGKGKNFNKCGAIVCKMECGKQFKVGSGLSDHDRAHPPKVGSIITYKFQELTNSGSPRFPSYVGIRIDMDGPKDAIIRKVTKSDDD